MKEVIVSLMQTPAGISVAIVMGFALLTFAIWYVFYIVYLPVASFVSVMKIKLERHRLKKAGLVDNYDFHYASIPQVGLTMADGGSQIKEKEPSDKES